MRRVNYYVACSIDGFIETKGGDTSAFDHRETAPFDFAKTLAAFDALLMGRKTYDYSRRQQHETDPDKENYVFSRTMPASPDKNVEIVAKDMIGFVHKLKQKLGKDIWLVGGADIATQLFVAGLIDDLIIKVNPVVFGSGTSLFGDIIPQTELKLVDSSVYPGSYLVNHYRLHALPK